MKCKPKQFDMLLTAIVGTGVLCNNVIILAVGGLANVVYVVVKKKLSLLTQLAQVAPEPSSLVAWALINKIGISLYN